MLHELVQKGREIFLLWRPKPSKNIAQRKAVFPALSK
jgi:hypothetical protein